MTERVNVMPKIQPQLRLGAKREWQLRQRVLFIAAPSSIA